MQPKEKRRPRRRLLTLTLLVTLLFASALFLFACRQSVGGKTHNSDGNSEEELLSGSELSQYTIVRGDNSGNPILKQALSLRSSLRSRGDVDLPLSTDFIPDSGKPEILVGMTNRKASAQVALDLTESTKFIVRSVDNKIVVLANTQKGLAEAVSFLAAQCSKGSGTPPDLHAIDHTEPLDEVVLMNENRKLQFVLPNGSSEQFVAYANAIIESFGIEEFTPVHQNEFTAEHAVYVGTVTSDSVSVSYKEIIGENEYTARLAANNVYLQGESELLTLTALGDFMSLLCDRLDYDFKGNLCVSLPSTVNFSKTWEHMTPRPIKGTLVNAESISSDTSVFDYSNVPIHVYDLYKRQLTALGFHSDPVVTNYYQKGSTVAILDYRVTSQQLSVMITSSIKLVDVK